MKINERLKQLRKERKLTQKELAHELNVPYRTLINWELGKRNPTYDNMIKLQEFFYSFGAYLRGESDKRTPMEKWEDPELMEAMDQSLNFMTKNIVKLLDQQPERTRADYYSFFVELQHILKYDHEIQDYIINILVNTLSACSRVVDTSIQMKEDGVLENDPKYQYVAERELNEISNSIKSIASFIEFE